MLPDSRLADRDMSTVMADWALPDGRTVRIECSPVYCANCGSMYGYVPKDNTVFVMWLCNRCFEQYGAVAGTYAVPDEQFCKDVAHEMHEAYGRTLSDWELFNLMERGALVAPLVALEKESPYRVYRAS
jgi:hypothetical protein